MENILKWNKIIFYIEKQNINCFINITSYCIHIFLLLLNSYLFMENIQKWNNMAFMYGIYLTS
jgi:hypothetical protein